MAIKQVVFVNRCDAESRIGNRDWVAISISDPFSDPPTLEGGWQSVLRLRFSDIEKEDKPSVMFSARDAQSIIDFVWRANEAGVENILVHCKAGVSRSAAVAKWIAGEYHLPFDHDYFLYNRHIYSTLCKIANGSHDAIMPP